jgi:hypothetical protein
MDDAGIAEQDSGREKMQPEIEWGKNPREWITALIITLLTVSPCTGSNFLSPAHILKKASVE